MDDVSPACTKLLLWVNAVKLLYETNKIIEPLEAKVQTLTKKKQVKEVELKETNENLAELTKNLNELNEKKDKKQSALKLLTDKVENMKMKLDKAEKLIRDLTSEKVRWSEEKEKLISMKEYLFG